MSRSTASDAHEVAGLRKEVAGLRDEIAGLKGQIESLGSNVCELFTRLGAVNQKVDDQKTATSCSGTPVVAPRTRKPAKAPPTRGATTPSGKARCRALTQAGHQCSKSSAEGTNLCSSHKDYKGKLVDLSGVAEDPDSSTKVEDPDSSTKVEDPAPAGNPAAVAGSVPTRRSKRGAPASDLGHLAAARAAVRAAVRADAEAKARATIRAAADSHHSDSDSHGSSRAAAAADSRQPDPVGSDCEGDRAGDSDGDGVAFN